jgi:hypothetical protein
MRLWWATVVIAIAAIIASMFGSASAASPAGTKLVQTVTIGQARYAVIDALKAASLIPNPTVRKLSTLVKACPAVHAYGFYANPSEVGFVAWIPANIVSCWSATVTGGPGVTGGGPTGTTGCFQGFRSSDGGSYVVIAGTNSRICPNISAEVPGGISIQGGTWSGWRVKCYALDPSGHLLDFIAPYSPTLPANKPGAGYVLDTTLGGGGIVRQGVPNCFGVRVG